MKKFFYGVLAAFTLAMLLPLCAQAQMPQPVPIDSAVRVGKLDNGLTYYIRKNAMPKGQADFFIAQKVGSILENDDQRGLAHFLEHMCFNGTEHFPGNSLVDWLGSVGVKFGQNLNAYTSIDETVYNISSVPVQRTGVQDSCLLILHDWADALLLDPAEIDSERGVIHQEWRRSNQGIMRLYEQMLPVIYPGNKYGQRLPIGTMEVVDNFAPQVLRDYYETWYRPDQQGIIVVGDIDPDYIEAKIKELFGPIKMPENAREREYLAVEDTPGTIYAIGTDKEMPMSMAMLMFKQPQKLLPDQFRPTTAYYGVEFIKTMLTRMLSTRLSDLAKQPNTPFSGVNVELGDFFISKTKDALMLQINGKGNDITPAIAATYREVLRAARGGFTETEFNREKADYIAQLEKAYTQRSGKTNTAYAREYVRNFVDGDPIPGEEYDYKAMEQISNGITVDVLNQVFPMLITSDNRILAVFLPENENIMVPTEQSLAEMMAAVDAEDIEPFKEELKAEPFIENLPAAVEPKVSKNAQWDATELIYPNGARVILKETKFKEGEIQFTAVAKGGLSAMQVSPASVTTLPYFMSAAGYGTYNSSDMKKYLAGKQTVVGMGFDDYSRTLSGSTTPKNVETLMELIYMSFVDCEITENDFLAKQSQFVAQLENLEKTPDFAFQVDMLKNIYNAPQKQMVTMSDFQNANRDEIIAIVHNMFSNPGDFTFVFAGDIDVAKLTDLSNKYIGSLRAPRVAGIPYVENPDFAMTVGANTAVYTMKMEQPQTYVSVSLSANVPYTAKNKALASITGQVLTKRLIKKIREEMGAVYSISAMADLDRLGQQNYSMLIPFPMKPEAKNEVLAEISNMVNSMSTNISEDELKPVIEFMVKQAAENLEKNNAWTGAICGATLNGVDTFNGASEVYNAITVNDVQAFMEQVLTQNNYRVMVLEPDTK